MIHNYIYQYKKQLKEKGKRNKDFYSCDDASDDQNLQNKISEMKIND